MAVKCDGCGTEENVKRVFVTVWNGHIVDACWKCAHPIITLLDKFSARDSGRWLQD